MASLLNNYLFNAFDSHELTEQVNNYFTYYGRETVLFHSQQVADQANDLAQYFGLEAELAYQAGLLHDISAVIPHKERIAIQEEQGAVIYKEEYKLPMLLHQRQSVYIAKKVFNIRSEKILSAICCHTTLKSKATDLDKCVFIADKIKWDREGTPPYESDLKQALNVSLDKAVLVYIDWLYETDLQVEHPRLKAAKQEAEKTDERGR